MASLQQATSASYPLSHNNRHGVPSLQQLDDIRLQLEQLEHNPEPKKIKTLLNTIAAWEKLSQAAFIQHPGKSPKAPTFQILATYSQKATILLQRIGEPVPSWPLLSSRENALPTPEFPPNADRYLRNQLTLLDRASHNCLGEITSQQRYILAKNALAQRDDAALAGLVRRGLLWSEIFDGSQLLIHCVKSGFSETLRELLKQNPDIFLRTKEGDSLLHLAFLSAREKIVHILRPLFDPRIQNASGKTPLAAFLEHQKENRVLTPLQAQHFISSIIEKAPTSPASTHLAQQFPLLSFDNLDIVELGYLLNDEIFSQKLFQQISRKNFELAYKNLLKKYPNESVRKFYATVFTSGPAAYELIEELAEVPKLPPAPPTNAQAYTLDTLMSLCKSIDWKTFSPAKILQEAQIDWDPTSTTTTAIAQEVANTFKKYPQELKSSDQILSFSNSLKSMFQRLQNASISKGSKEAELLGDFAKGISTVYTFFKPVMVLQESVACSEFLEKVQNFSTGKQLDNFLFGTEEACYQYISEVLQRLHIEIKNKEIQTCFSGVRYFLENVAKKKPFFGTPPQGTPALNDFYTTIRNELLHVAATLQQKNDKDLCYDVCKELVRASAQCGGKYYSTAFDLYFKVCHGKSLDSPTATFMASIAEYRRMCFQSTVAEIYTPSEHGAHSHNTNIHNRALRELGEKFGISGFRTARRFKDPFNHLSYNYLKIENRFQEIYTPTQLVYDWILPQIKSDEKLQHAYIDSHVALLPKDWNNDRYAPILAEVSRCSSPSEKEKILRDHEIFPRPHQTAEAAIEEDRKHDFLNTVVYDESFHFRPEAVWRLLESLNIVQCRISPPHSPSIIERITKVFRCLFSW
jgi:hypothetical protein